MVNMSLRELVRACGGEFYAKQGPVPEGEIRGVATDNRNVRGGELFVAIIGANNNGNRYAKDALEKGARAVLTSDPQTAIACGAEEKFLIAVPDTVTALGKIAHYWLSFLRSLPGSRLRTVGITGSVGKTTTKDLLAEMLLPLGPVVAPPNSFNNEIGLALTVLRADERTVSLVLEMGADAVGNIRYLTSVARPDIAVVLTVAKAHLGSFGNLETVARAKQEIVEAVPAAGAVFLSADNEYTVKMKAASAAPVYFFAADPKNSSAGYACAVENLSSAGGYAVADMRLGSRRVHFTLGLAGVHQIHNAAAAAAVASYMGVGDEDILRVLTHPGKISSHRMDVRRVAGKTVIDDSYNANPASMRAGILALGAIGNGCREKIAVLGEMLELGGHSVSAHRSLAGDLREAGINTVLAVGGLYSYLAQELKGTDINCVTCESLAEAEQWLKKELKPGAAVLFKGSNGSGIWKLADKMMNGEIA